MSLTSIYVCKFRIWDLVARNGDIETIRTHISLAFVPEIELSLGTIVPKVLSFYLSEAFQLTSF